MVELWRTAQWKGPSLMINVHPACLRVGFSFPDANRIIICHGSEDKVWTHDRSVLEGIISSRDVSTRNKRMLYFVGSSGETPNGGKTRVGDAHNMQVKINLIQHTCMRLMFPKAEKTPVHSYSYS